jgi:2-polyprenyl-3-methyl-5-hydroxy-6-metoxy-1,4-benzoquinol methylase
MDNHLGDENFAFWMRQYSETTFVLTPLPAASVELVVNRLSEFSCRRVLDLGCGFGRMAVALALHGFDVTAIDLIPAAIDFVKEWASKESVTVTTRVCAAEQLDTIGEYDAVYCNSVLDHMQLASAQLSMENIVRALKPGGIAYISFDAQDKENPQTYTLLEDGTLLYTLGRRKGKLWRYFSDDEIRGLCGDLEMLEFTIDDSGKRGVWCRNS